MAEILDMSLDDIIKNNKKSNPSSGGDGRRRGGSGSGGGGGAGGPTKRPFKRSGNRQGPYQPPKAPDVAWKHDMYPAVAAGGGAGGGRLSAIETGTKLYISNLDFGVSNDDIKIEGEAAINLAAKVNSDWTMKKWYLCWLLLVASAMVLTNHFIANGGDNPVVPDSKLIIPALIEFIVFLCAACFMFCTTKQ